MTIHAQRGEFLPDPDTAAFIRVVERQSAWRIFPYGEWHEPRGSRVIFDRQYRPICRVHIDGRVDIVLPETWITFKRQRWFHRGFGPSPDTETRSIATEIMQRYGLEPELRRRRELQRCGLLPSSSTRPCRRPLAA